MGTYTANRPHNINTGNYRDQLVTQYITWFGLV